MRQRIFWALAFVAVVPFLLANLAKAQSSIQPAFTPTIDQKLDARTSAQVTSDDESALASKGYVKIGTISASQPGKKENPDITRQLESAILQKAAEVGGDVVRFSKEGSFEEKDVPTGKTKTKGKCDNYIKYMANGKFIVACNSWHNEEIPITNRETDLISEGTVWRYDPSLATNIAARAESSVRAFASLSSKLGKDINSAEMKTWLSSLGTPEIDRHSNSYYYSYKPAGISLEFNTQDQLDAISFYSEADGYSQYQSDLPYGLSFQKTRREIENILGPPDSFSGGIFYIWTSYNSKGIVITYNTKRSDDMNARVHDIMLK
jgi:hypothetical protein